MPVSESTLAISFLLVGILVAKGVALRFFRQRERLRDVLQHSLDAMNEGFVLYDKKDRLVMWNERARRTHSPSAQAARPGTSFERILRLEVADGHFPEAIGREEEWIAMRLAGHRAARLIPEEQLTNGRRIKITKDRTSEGYLVSLILDVTEMKAAQEAAEAGNRAKSEMLTNISHELRTPLTVVLGHSGMLSRADELLAAKRIRAMVAEGAANPDQLEAEIVAYLDSIKAQGRKIRNSSQHLLDLVNEILDLARIESGRIDLRPEVKPAGAVLQDVVEEFRTTAEEKGLTLSWQSDGTVVHADRLRLRQILYNLLGNALKFTSEGSISITARGVDGGACLRVEDTGCGIAEEHLDRIFESFHQVDSSDARSQHGSGLGLALTKRLVELHGGRISVSSEPGHGAAFEVFLPEQPGAPEVKRRRPPTAAATASKEKVAVDAAL